MSKITVHPASNKISSIAGKALPLEIQVIPELTIGAVKRQIAAKSPKVDLKAVLHLLTRA